MSINPPYKTHNGIWYTKSLFYETADIALAARSIDPVFTLYTDRPDLGLISARKTFVELQDPTGYEWCMKYLGDWEHWQKLIKCKWFQEALDYWLVELHAKMRAENLARLRVIAADPDNKSQPVAARYLIELDKKPGGRGRPSKEAIHQETVRIAREANDIHDDMARLGLKVITNG